MTNKDWELILSIHSEKTKTPPNVVNYIAVNSIIEGCVRGLSITTLAESYNMDVDYIIEVLKEFLDFPGWEQDLSLDPYSIYKSSQGISEIFFNAISTMSSEMSDEQIQKAYKICYIYSGIAKEIEKYE